MWSHDSLLHMFRCHPIHMSSSRSCPMNRRRTMMSPATSRRRSSMFIIGSRIIISLRLRHAMRVRISPIAVLDLLVTLVVASGA